VPPASQEELVAMGVLVPVPNAEQVAAQPDEPEATDNRRRPPGDDDDDEWFDEDPLGRVTR
jgi:hypothetical protein